MPPTADALVERATEVRERLFSALEALDRKRHTLTAPVAFVQHALARPAVRPWFIVGGAAGALVTVGLAVNVYRRSASRARRTELVRHAAFSVGLLLAVELARIAARRLRAGLT